MKTTLTRVTLPVMLITVGLLAGIASAQPDLGAAKGANPPNRTPGQLAGNMTPEQRRAMMQGRIEEQLQTRRAEILRQSLTQGGFDDKTVQDAVVDFSNEQVKAALTLREKTSKVSDAVADKASTDPQISALLNDLHAARDDEKTRRETAEKALDAKISYTQKPRLEALLTTLNLIGEDSGGLMNIMGGMSGGRAAAFAGGAFGGGALGGGAAGGGFGRGGQNGFAAGGAVGGGAFGGAQGGAGEFGGGRRGFGGGFAGRGGFGANQNGAGNGQNAPGADVFGLRRERGLRRDQRGANGNNDNAAKDNAAKDNAAPDAKPEAKVGA